MSAQATLVDLIRAWARRQPHAAALVGLGVHRTWADLESRTDAIAARFRHTGVRPGDRVGLLGANGPAWIEVFVGVLKAGAAAVPLNYRLAPAERAQVLEDAGVALLVAEPELLEGARFAGETVRMDTACASAAAAGAAEPAPGPDDLAVIAYTSGTTALPKGAMWSHRGLRASAAVNPFSESLAGGARILVCAPLGAGGALVMACNALAIGATLVVVPFAPDLVLQTLVAERVAFTGLVPTMIAVLADAAPPGWRAPSLRRVFYGAGTMSPALHARAVELLGCEFEQGYGMTETCIFGTRLEPADHTPDRLALAGRPMPGVDLKIVDEEGAEMPAGSAGEVVIRSPGNMLGYWQREEENRQAFRDGWYRTRDIGRWEGAGYLQLLDRKDDMVKSGGFNVSPAEVERVLAAHPGVAEAAVIGLADGWWGERVAAVVRRGSGAALNESELAAFCRARLADYKTPRTVIFTDEPLPRNSLGKVVRRTLRMQYGKERAP